MIIDAAYILGAGIGTRMGPIGTVLPKPLWPIFEKTCLDFVIMQVKALGIKKIIINTHHLADKIDEHLKKNYQSQIDVLHEPNLLGSGGAIHNFKKKFPFLKRVLVLNADFFFLITPDILKMALQQMRNDASLLFAITVPFGSGLNQIRIEQGLLKSIILSQIIEPCATYETYAGVCILNLEALAYRPGNSSFFDSVADFQEKDVPVFFDNTIAWYDVGTKLSYQTFYHQFMTNWLDKKEDALRDMLIQHSFIIPEKMSHLRSYGVGNESERAFNFDHNWRCTHKIPSNTFILKASDAPINASGIYFEHYVDKN